MKYGALILLVALTSCGSPGRRVAEPRVVRPSEVTDFGVLYRQNCSGCHGIDGQGALTVAIGNPEYLAIADSATIRRVIERGQAWNRDARFRSKRWRTADRSADRHPCPRDQGTLGQARCIRQRQTTRLCSLTAGRRSAGPQRIHHVLFFLPWFGGARRPGRLDRRQLVSCARERSAPAHRNHHWHAGTGRTGLARRRAREANVRCRRDGCRGMARGSAAAFVCEIESSRRSRMSDLSRRQMFMKIAALFNGIVGVLLAVPIVRYVLSPVTRAAQVGL